MCPTTTCELQCITADWLLSLWPSQSPRGLLHIPPYCWSLGIGGGLHTLFCLLLVTVVRPQLPLLVGWMNYLSILSMSSNFPLHLLLLWTQQWNQLKPMPWLRFWVSIGRRTRRALLPIELTTPLPLGCSLVSVVICPFGPLWCVLRSTVRVFGQLRLVQRPTSPLGDISLWFPRTLGLCSRQVTALSLPPG